MVLDFPGSVTITAVDVCVFSESNEAHVDITATMGDAIISCTVGRYDPQAESGRLTLASVEAWAAERGLIHSHDDEPAENRAGETYVVVHLVGNARKSVWGQAKNE